jgi:hypothetical protein
MFVMATAKHHYEVGQFVNNFMDSNDLNLRAPAAAINKSVYSINNCCFGH